MCISAKGYLCKLTMKHTSMYSTDDLTVVRHGLKAKKKKKRWKHIMCPLKQNHDK